MLKTIGALITLLALLVVGGLAAAVWYAFYGDKWELERVERALAEREQEIGRLSGQLDASRKKIVALNEELEAKQREIERLDTAVRLLKVDHRVAQVDVLEQRGAAEDGSLVTRISFVEVDESGKPLEEPRVFTIEGDMVHVAALVVKFADEHVEMGDPLRSTSLCLFKRIYGDKQEPEKGFPLDTIGSRPAAYGDGRQMSDLEKEIWAKFWDYANDAQKARAAGVRAAHGEAVFQKVRPGKRYKVLLRASGGLTIIPEDRPANPTDPTL